MSYDDFLKTFIEEILERDVGIKKRIYFYCLW